MRNAFFIVFAVMYLSIAAFAQTPQLAVQTNDPATSTVVVAEPAAPPQFVQDLLVKVQALPVVGPIVTKAIFYGGMLASVLTLIVGSLMALLQILSGLSSLSGLAAFAEKLKAFQNGKIMYYLKYLSILNAQKPVSTKDIVQPLAKEKAA